MSAAGLVVPAYVRAHLLMTDDEIAATTDELERCAKKHGYALGQVFVEELGEVSAAFTSVMQVINDERPAALVVPSVLHLAPLGLPPQLVHHLEIVTGVRMLIANAPEPAEPVSDPHSLAGSALRPTERACCG